MPLSIGIDARPLSHPYTGIGRYTHAILSRIIGSEHRFHLYASQPLATEYRGATVRCRNNAEARLRSTIDAQLYFPRWGRADELDVFWSPRHHLPLRMRAPCVVTVHDLVWRAVPETMAPFARHVERALMRPSVRKARAVIAVSESTRQDLSAWQPALSNKLTVIPEAPCVTPDDLDETQADLPERYFLFVGTFEPRKNLKRLIQAFANVAGLVPHHLVLAGGRGWGNTLQECVDGLPADVQSRVHRFHPDQGVPLATLYARCEAFVLPSLYEGFGLPLAEAMSFGKPLLTADNSSLPEVAGPAAIYVDATCIGSIADGLKRLATDGALRESLAKHSETQAAKFSWDQAAQQTLSVLETAVSNSAPTR